MRARVTTPMDPEDPTRETASVESWTVRERLGKPVSAATAPLLRPGAVLADRYDLRRVLGRGGMGVVFEAYDRVLRETVAIKIVRADYAGERAWAERLAREVKLARQICHPNVCRVFDFGEAEVHPFLTMEIAQGGTLRDELAKGGVLSRPVDGRLSDARSLASGLAAIHAAGIIHRDVAPQNALRMDDGRLVLSDFGLATDKFDGSTSVHGGTVAYMAPEVVRGGHASTRADIWSLGVVVHEAMFGVRPRWSSNGHDMLPPALGRALRGAERRAFDVCRACARFSSNSRPRFASEVADALTKGVRLSARTSRLRALCAVALVVTMCVSVAVARNFVRDRRRSNFDGSEAAKLLRASGSPRDWTGKAKVLATVPDKIRCMSLLPDRRTVRFVWGTPRRAEDLDTHTGQRIPSPLVPAAYAEGCPDVTRDGSKIVFAGHGRDLRSAAFVSTHPDGRDAIPVVQTGEPSLFSDPTWLPDNDSFLYPIDINHSAIFSVPGRTSMVVPADTHLAFATGYRVVGNAVIVTTLSSDDTTDIRRLRFPHLEEDLHTRFEGGLLEVASPDGRLYYAAGTLGDKNNRLIVLDSETHAVRRSAFVADRFLRSPMFSDAGLILAASFGCPVLVVTSSGGDAAIRFAARRVIGFRLWRCRRWHASRRSAHGARAARLVGTADRPPHHRPFAARSKMLG